METLNELALLENRQKYGQKDKKLLDEYFFGENEKRAWYFFRFESKPLDWSY